MLNLLFSDLLACFGMDGCDGKFGYASCAVRRVWSHRKLPISLKNLYSSTRVKGGGTESLVR